MFDLTASAARAAALVAGVREDQLENPTPCPEMRVRELVAHLHGLAIAFRDAAAKIDGPTTMTPPDPGASVLAEDWREGAPAALDELGRAWRDPAAWQGMTRAGGVEMPGEVTAMVALDELVLHGWDLAVATGQSYDPDTAALEVAEQFCAGIGEDPTERSGLFGPRVPVAADSSRLDRVLGLSGRDPSWSPPRG
ncbi:TIGR03086 family metal-binding protein [Brachybacterium hainanense]|uniref:TIGR03086 family metal-binding protein n=1 Tax=Brachybacterium hainanense TaxID=1541174 RepID=A0ABV6R8F3_9MICO